MLDVLKTKNLYRNTICAMVGDRGSVTSVADDTYDVIVMSGAFLMGHLPVESLREFIRMIKPGTCSKLWHTLFSC